MDNRRVNGGHRATTHIGPGGLPVLLVRGMSALTGRIDPKRHGLTVGKITAILRGRKRDHSWKLTDETRGKRDEKHARNET